jgi:iron complex outermembrane recepter protein
MIRKALGGCGLIGLAAVPIVAFAQQAASGSDQLQEVVVTATRRESTVHETPISITAMSGEEIESRGTQDFDTLAQSVPGLAMKSSGPGQTEFEMRGLASVGGNSAVVGFYLDDTPLSAPGGAFNGRIVIDPDLYDLNRVEVLRGPQGTLYGSSSMGGTIKVITNAPDPKSFDASGEAILSDTDGGDFNYSENGMLNLPLGSSAALRIVGTESHDSGWLDRVVIAAPDFPLETGPAPLFPTRGDLASAPVATDYKGVNYEDLTGARATLLWSPTDRLDITPMIFFQRIAQGGLNQIDSVPGANAHYQPFDSPEGYDDRIDLGSLAIKYHFDGFDLVSDTARWKREALMMEDATEEIQWAVSSALGALLPFYISQGGFGIVSPDFEQDYTDQWSEEIRLTSTSDSAFQWLVGYFYSDFNSETDLNVIWPGAVPAFGTSNAFTQHQPIKILQNSAFGELSYQITPELKATAGVRRYSFVSEISNSQSGALSATGSPAVLTTSNTERSQGANPKAELTYEPNKELLLYATAARGFRPGGGNQAIPTGAAGLGPACEAALMSVYDTTAFVPSPTTFSPDSIWSYEIGEKAESDDHRLSLNAAEYYERWDHVQQYVPLSCGFPFSTNAGDARIYGSEIELSLVPLSGLQISANGSYTQGTFLSSSFGGLLVASGDQLQNIPKWTLSQSVLYHFPLTQSVDLIARVDNNYVGRRIDVTFGVNQLPSYDLTNIRFGVSGAQWVASLFLNNAFNKRALIDNVLQYNIDVPTFNRTTVSQPLTVGVDFSYHLH